MINVRKFICLIFLGLLIASLSACSSNEIEVVSDSDNTQSTVNSQLEQFATPENTEEVFNTSQGSILDISNDIGVDCSAAQIISEYKTTETAFVHACKLSFNNDSVTSKIKESGLWKDCYSARSNKSTNVTMLFQNSSSLLSNFLPLDLRPAQYFKNGYYIFINHNALLMNLTNKFDEFALESEYHNFTFAFYDTDNNNLYYYKYNDTSKVLNSIGKELGIDLTNSAIVKQDQTYWNAYSYKYPKITYYEIGWVETSAVKTNTDWKDLPTSQKVSEILSSKVANLVTTSIPEVNKGQYLYVDLLDYTVNHDENINSIIAIFDENSNKIYYYKIQYFQPNN